MHTTQITFLADDNEGRDRVARSFRSQSAGAYDGINKPLTLHDGIHMFSTSVLIKWGYATI